eukprot:10719122-Ditylum_brightwellii.AAC.1
MSSQFKTSSTLAIPKPSTVKSVTFATSLSTESNPTEEKWWVGKFGLGSATQKKYLRVGKQKSVALRPKKIQFNSPSNAIISQIVFCGSKSGSNATHHQIAVVSGPRVSLYSGTASSSLSLNLANSNKKKKNLLLEDEDSDDDDDDEVVVNVKPDRNVRTGGSPAHCVSYRDDGRLVAIGTDDGCIKVCDATSRATIRTFGGSGNLAVRAVSWCRGGKKIVSAGDDGVVRVWDLSAGIGGGVDSDKRAMVHLSGHGDAVRSCVVLSVKREEGDDDGDSGDNKKWKEVVVSGSYDHTIRVWDIESKETEKCLSIMNHGVPVEALLVLPPSFFKNTASSSSKNKNIPTTPLIVSAGGTILKIWNPLTGKCLGELQTKHSKTITSCTSATISKEVEDGKTVQYKRIITGGLDGLIRVYSADQIFTSSSGEKILHFLHGVKVQHPITALGMSPDQTRFVV